MFLNADCEGLVPAPLACFVSDCGIMEILPSPLLFECLSSRRSRTLESSESATEANRSRPVKMGFTGLEEKIIFCHFSVHKILKKKKYFIIVYQTVVIISTLKLLNFSDDVTKAKWLGIRTIPISQLQTEHWSHYRSSTEFKCHFKSG